MPALIGGQILDLADVALDDILKILSHEGFTHIKEERCKSTDLLYVMQKIIAQEPHIVSVQVMIFQSEDVTYPFYLKIQILDAGASLSDSARLTFQELFTKSLIWKFNGR